MTQLTLYHSTRCPFSRRVRIVLEELGLAYDDVEVALDAPPRWFESVSPGGQVPCLVHGDLNLVESNTINEYLVEAFEGALMPEAPADRAHVRLIMQWTDDEWMGTFRAFETAVDVGPAERAEAKKAELLKRLDDLEDKSVGRGPFLIGGDLTLADVALATTLTELPRLGVPLRRHPRTAALVDALLTRRSCQTIPTTPQGPVLRRSGAA